MCFHSATGGFLPNRVSALEQVLSLHLQVPSSHLLLLQTKSQLTQVEHAFLSQMLLLECAILTRVYVFTGRCSGVADAAESLPGAQVDGCVSGAPACPQTGAAG